MQRPSFSLIQLAERFDLRLSDPRVAAIEIDSVNTLSAAGPTQLSFFANASYADAMRSSNAAAVVLHERDLALRIGPALVSSNPYADFARIAGLFEDPTPIRPGIHASACIETGANVDPSAEIGAFCVISATARIAAGVRIGAHCVVGPDCQIDSDCVLEARVTLVKRVQLARGVRIHSGAVLGADGFGFAPDSRLLQQPEPTFWRKVPQLGRVIIGPGCDIGAHTTIDCGALDDTILGRGVVLDNQIQIGHNVQIGDFTAIAGCTAIAGSTKIGAHCLIAGAVGIAGHLTICDHVTILAMSLVGASIEEKGTYAAAMPLMTQRDWRKNAVQLRRLDISLRALQKSRESGTADTSRESADPSL